MKHIIVLIGALLLAATAFAQATPPVVQFSQTLPAVQDPFIKGDLLISFNTRTQLDGDKPKIGVADKYKLKLNVSNSILFDGTIESLPNIKGMIGLAQQGKLTHAIECSVINPKNTAQTRNIGRLYGTVPVDEQNVYRFEDGNLRIGIFGSGGAQGFESRVRGLALGKPPAVSNGIFSKLKKEALNIGRTVNGKNVAITVTKYDKMEFVGHVLSAGPVMVYPEATVNGPLIYDYDRTAWYFQGVTVAYVVDGRQMMDRLSGNIRWVEASDRASSGKGEYQFDVRVNEPAATEAAVFAGPADESAFFATDVVNPSLTGTMQYKDTMVGDDVTQSIVQIDLKGNKLTKQQAMYLAKLLLMSSIVPLNAE